MTLSSWSRRALAVAGCAWGVGLSPVAAGAEGDPGATLVVRVSGFESDNGALGCRLFSQPSSFPDGQGVDRRRPIEGTRGSCTFRDVAPGTYAIAAIHDENGNAELDKNFVGIPTEGYGVSNNKTRALSAPKWSEAKFSVAAGELRRFAIRLRY